MTILPRWRAEGGTWHFVSCSRHARVPTPGTEPGRQRQPRRDSRSPTTVPVLRREGLVWLAPRWSRAWCCGREAGGGTNRQLPISQASGEEAHHRGDALSLRRSHQRASCTRTALLQRAGEEQSQVQASGTGYRLSRNSTRRETLLNATKMPASH